jgi:pimeloyl-ACP methyl ester carboxylesterase
MSGADSQTNAAMTAEPAGANAGPTRRKGARAGLVIIRVAVMSYVAILVALMCMETRMVYPGVYVSPRRAAVQAQVDGPSDLPIIDVAYVGKDGVALQGRLLDRPGGKNTVLFFHGNATRAKWLDSWCRRLSRAFDATVMLAEYRGFDGLGPSPNEPGVLSDCVAAHQYLCDREGIGPDEIILYGRSLGGACAVAVAAQAGAKALVLDRTFDCIVNVAAQRFPFVPVRWLMRNRYDSVARIVDYDGFVVQVHGPDDSVIPMRNGRRLFDAVGGPKQWIEMPGLGHNDALSSDSLQQIVNMVERQTSTWPSRDEDLSFTFGRSGHRSHFEPDAAKQVAHFAIDAVRYESAAR